MSDLDFSKVKEYHEGIITKAVLERCCCTVLLGEDVALRYIVATLESGEQKLIYEDEEKFRRVERDFHENRFTSYHELFTTKELAEEEKFGRKFKYYVRFTEDMYVQMNIDEAMEALTDCTKGEDVVTALGKYLTAPN